MTARASPTPILVVDDRPEQILALDAVLAPLGHHVVRARLGSEALRMLAERDFAAVLLDVHMPQMDGFEVAAAIRRADRNQRVPIVFLTADDRTDEIERAFALGRVDYLPKPINPTFLRGKLATLVELFRQSAQLEALSSDQHDRRRIEGELRERNHLLALTAQVGVALGGTGTIRDVLRTCAESLVHHLDAAFARIWTLDDGGDVLELQASAGMYTHLDGAHGRVPVGRLKIGLIAAERAPHLTNDVVGDPRVGDQEWAVREGMVGFAGYPLIAGGRLVGVVAAFARHPFSSAALGAMEAIAEGLAQGIDRRRAEDRLRVSEDWLGTTLTSIGDGVIATDPAGKVTFLNPVASALTGWTTEDARGRELCEVFRIVSEATHAVVESPVTKVIREGGTVGLANHTLLVRRDGTEAPIEDSAAPIRDPNGRLLGVVLVFRDGTERRQAEVERARMLEESEQAHRQAENARQHLHALLMQAPAAVCVLAGPDHRIELTNPRYERLLQRRDLVGRTVAEALPEAVEQGFTRVLDAVYSSGERLVGVEAPIELAVDGGGVNRLIVTFVYEPYRDLEGNVAGVLVMGLDVTETVSAREKIDEARKRAEQSEAQHREARDEAERMRAVAERASMEKDQFFATISHELRTPLTSILGWARMLRTRPELVEKGLATIERNARAQAQLIEDMLDTARIASGKLAIDPKPLFVTTALEAAIDSARPGAAAKGLSLEAEIDPNAGTIFADAERLQQVISNLTANAIKFTPRGGAIRVVAHRTDSALEIVVEDTGKGIAPEFLPHVFERFRQSEPGSAGGLGLGLAIVRAIVELHGGDVGVESEGSGKGARFRVRFPLHVSGPAGEEAQGVAKALPRILVNAEILVVDDEDDARDVIAEILTRAGANVRTASSVDEALAIVESTRPDAVVSDIGMPVRDGYALIHELRTSPRYAADRLPVVALTAFARTEDRMRALTAGFSSYIAKPVDPAEIAIVVANVLGRIPGV